VLKKLNLQDLKGVEEVNIFMSDEVIHIRQPKIQASIPCNTYVVSGNTEKKKLAELLPDIVTQLGPEQMATLRRYAETTMGAGGAGGGAGDEEEDDDDDDVPELVENFEQAAK
jgi:nascent polypeptide-associated complex subunit beta